VQIFPLQRKHPSAKQINASAAMHGALERLRSVDLTLRLPVAPRIERGVANRFDVLPQRPDKASHAVDATGAGVVQPDVQPLSYSARLLRDPVPSSDFCNYKYNVDIDGNSNSWPGLFAGSGSGKPIEFRDPRTIKQRDRVHSLEMPRHRPVLMFSSGPAHGAGVGSYRGDPLYNASLDPDEYAALLGSIGFEVVAHAVED
jgi:hypothetical protein